MHVHMNVLALFNPTEPGRLCADKVACLGESPVLQMRGS